MGDKKVVNFGAGAPSIPEGDRGTQNGDVSSEAKSGKRTREMSEGPNLGERGEYLPASYEVKYDKVTLTRHDN